MHAGPQVIEITTDFTSAGATSASPSVTPDGGEFLPDSRHVPTT
jgi:hypothetical protein